MHTWRHPGRRNVAADVAAAAAAAVMHAPAPDTAASTLQHVTAQLQ